MKVYVYLAHRDKFGINLIGILNSHQNLHNKIEDIKILKLPIDIENKLSKIVSEHKRKWDLWIETCESYNLLIQKLKNRGFKNIPYYSSVLIDFNLDNLNLNTGFTAKLI